jgi:hypothetical protein
MQSAFLTDDMAVKCQVAVAVPDGNGNESPAEHPHPSDPFFMRFHLQCG